MSQFINSMNVYFIQPVLQIYFHARVYFSILNVDLVSVQHVPVQVHQVETLVGEVVYIVQRELVSQHLIAVVVVVVAVAVATVVVGLELVARRDQHHLILTILDMIMCCIGAAGCCCHRLTVLDTVVALILGVDLTEGEDLQRLLAVFIYDVCLGVGCRIHNIIAATVIRIICIMRTLRRLWNLSLFI